MDGAPRSLSTQVSVHKGVTAESCTVACLAAGFVLAGLEFGQECCEYRNVLFPRAYVT